MLRGLDTLSFGGMEVNGDAEFVDEFELPPRHEGERGGAPDYAVLSDRRLWLIELKTEVASHRADQLPSYFAYARHHHPDRTVDITYLTPSFDLPPIDVPGRSRLAHLTWSQVMPVIEAIWGRSGGVSGRLVEALRLALDGLSTPWRNWRHTRLEDPVASARQLADLTSADGRQRALDHDFASLEEMQEITTAVRALHAAGSNVRPWIWREATSGGTALTEMGATVGHELRLSRYSFTV